MEGITRRRLLRDGASLIVSATGCTASGQGVVGQQPDGDRVPIRRFTVRDVQLPLAKPGLAEREMVLGCAASSLITADARDGLGVASVICAG